MKAGEQYRSTYRNGLGLKVTKVTKREITVDVERFVRRNGERKVETRTRVVLTKNWPDFIQGYEVGKP